MNPIVITGMLAMTVSAAVMMISFSNDQIRYSESTQKISEIQTQRISEEMILTTTDSGQIEVKNTGTVPVQIREVRIIDDQGHVTFRQKADQTIFATRTAMLDADSKITDVVISMYGDEEPK